MLCKTVWVDAMRKKGEEEQAGSPLHTGTVAAKPLSCHCTTDGSKSQTFPVLCWKMEGCCTPGVLSWWKPSENDWRWRLQQGVGDTASAGSYLGYQKTTLLSFFRRYQAEITLYVLALGYIQNQNPSFLKTDFSSLEKRVVPWHHTLPNVYFAIFLSSLFIHSSILPLFHSSSVRF